MGNKLIPQKRWEEEKNGTLLYVDNNYDRVLAIVTTNSLLNRWTFNGNIFLSKKGCKEFVERFVLLNMLDDDEE